MKLSLIFLPSCAASLGAVFTVAPDAHGLAVDVSNISLAAPANFTFSWTRVDRAAGGVVAVSRAFGDRHIRPTIRADPEITERRLVDGDAYLIIASDGLWDVVTNQARSAVDVDTVENLERTE